MKRKLELTSDELEVVRRALFLMDVLANEGKVILTDEQRDSWRQSMNAVVAANQLSDEEITAFRA